MKVSALEETVCSISRRFGNRPLMKESLDDDALFVSIDVLVCNIQFDPGSVGGVKPTASPR